MAKKLADKWDDTVRPGTQLGYEQGIENGNPFGVFIRKFDSDRMEMSDWILEGVLTTDEDDAKYVFEDASSACKSGAVMCAALVRVKDVYEPGKLSVNTDKWWCNGVCLDCRASHLLHGGQQAAKNQVPDGYQLSEALRAEFHLWMSSTDQTGDDTAKDKGHDTANGTPDPTPENTAVDHLGEPIPVATMETPTEGTTCYEAMTGNVEPERAHGNTRGKGKGKVKVSKP